MLKPISITLFNATGNSKVPISKHEDGKFIFITKTVPNLKDAFHFMVKQYSLSKPLNIVEPIERYRRISDLEEFSPLTINNIALDLDEILNKDDYIDVIEYFKDKNYSIILGKSRSWNGIDNFNLKGIIRVDIENNQALIKKAFSQMQSELGEKAKVDVTVANLVSVQAPSNNEFIVHYNEKGKVMTASDIHIEEVKAVLNTPRHFISYNNGIVDKALEIFFSLGYSINTGFINDSGSINFSHPSERKSVGSYFWYSSNPFIMNHHNKDKVVSIFHLIKETEEGKEWLKSKTKQEQSNQLIRPYNVNSYASSIFVNERYLDFTKEDKMDSISKFMETDKGVFKIKSAMGSAKSSGIEAIIKKAHEKNEKVILVSNRVSVALDFADKYNIMLYKDPSSINYKGSLVVQYDSLHRYDLSIYDVVIFDEFISLLLHHRANLTSNSNINAVKFKILMEKKKVVVADAFLTGYEDIFFKDREIYSIINEYKDSISLYEYKNKEFFVSTLIQTAKSILPTEHISCSFTSLNVMRVVEMELKAAGIKVISLSSETSQITRDIIYNKFKEDNHGAFQVILFTPTLTVGVSNLNNVTDHFHYDSGMSTDVISSLQMIKRSRTTKNIHYYVEERQYYLDTNIDSINKIAQKNINTFYNKKDKTLLIDIDYDTGNLKLTPLATYINQIEVFYNILANNHANAFKLLLNYQFEEDAEIVEEIDESFNLRDKIKEVKDKIKEDTLIILEEYSDTTWTPLELEDIRTKLSDKTNEEVAKLLMGGVQEKFKKTIPREDLLTLSALELESDFKFVSKVKNMKMALRGNQDDYTRYRLSRAISEDISSLQNKNHIDFLEYLLVIGDTSILKNSYSRNEIKAMDLDINKGKKFEKFLKRLGYEWGEARIRVDQRIFKYIDYL